MKKVAVIFILLCAIGGSAKDPNETHREIRSAVEKREYLPAIAALRNLQGTDREVFRQNNYDYLLARLSERQGDIAEAAANYQAVVERNSVLTEYALWHLAQISRTTGNLLLERIYLRELLTTAPDSLIARAARERISRSNLDSGDFTSAISGLRYETGIAVDSIADAPDDVFGYLSGNDPKTREKLVLLGRALLAAGKSEPARGILTKLIQNLPNTDQPDDSALNALRSLDRFDVDAAEVGSAVPPLDEQEHLRRATIYQFNRDFVMARLHYQSLIARFPDGPEIPGAMYEIGRGYARERNYSKAADWFERVQIEFPSSPFATDALSQAAAAYARVNKTKEAVSRYEKFIEKYPDSSYSSRAYLNIVDILRDRGEPASAINWTERTREKFRDQPPEAVALFARARIHLSQMDWTNALTDLDSLLFLGDLGGNRTPGGTTKEEITFLKGLVLERMDRIEEAIDVYLAIPEGRRQYFGWRASERLQALLKNDKTSDLIRRKFYPLRIKSSLAVNANNAAEIKMAAHDAIRLTDVKQTRQQLLETIRQTYSFLPEYRNIRVQKLIRAGRQKVVTEKKSFTGDRHQELSDELLFLGLYDEGTPELETAARGDVIDADFKFTLAVFYRRGDMAYRGISYIEPIWNKLPDDYRIELIPREQIELLYPVPFADSLIEFAPPRDVDPRFVLAIMRQESRFRADVKSAAAARGLMQFISSTSGSIANEFGQTEFRQDDLYNPPTAIKFGSQYLSNLFHQFPAQPQAVAASYNGGEDNMARWYARASSNDPDRYVPEILFAQSKDYVFKVMQNYRIYKMLYDDRLTSIDESGITNY